MKLGKILTILLFFYAFPAFSSDCMTSHEVNAVNLRALQSELMVAALSCDQRTHYNKFVKKYQSQLSDGGRKISGYFSRVYGNNSESKLNSFITKLANNASDKSLKDSRDDFCSNSLAIFSKIDKSGSIPVASNNISANYGIKACDQQLARQ